MSEKRLLAAGFLWVRTVTSSKPTLSVNSMMRMVSTCVTCWAWRCSEEPSMSPTARNKIGFTVCIITIFIEI